MRQLFKTLLLAVTMTTSARAAGRAPLPLACTPGALSPAERERHFGELGPRLAALATGTRELPDGYEFRFAGSDATFRLLAEWAAGERACCPFLAIAIESAPAGGALALRLRGGPGVKAFVREEFAAWRPR